MGVFRLKSGRHSNVLFGSCHGLPSQFGPHSAANTQNIVSIRHSV